MQYDIPQIFYDIIGRIVPGFIIIFIAILIYIQSFCSYGNIIDLLSLFKFNHFIVCLFIAYFVASAFSNLFDMIFKGEIPTEKKIYENATNDSYLLFEMIHNPNKILLPKEIPHYYVVHDLLRLLNPVEAKRLIKIDAEANASKILCLGLLFNFILYSCLNSSYCYLVLIILLFLSLLSFCIFKYCISFLSLTFKKKKIIFVFILTFILFIYARLFNLNFYLCFLLLFTSFVFYNRFKKLKYYFINGTWDAFWFYVLKLTNVEG